MWYELANAPAVGVMIYALTVYQRRARAIRDRTGAPYDDRLGPVSLLYLLSVLLLTPPDCSLHYLVGYVFPIFLGVLSQATSQIWRALSSDDCESDETSGACG